MTGGSSISSVYGRMADKPFPNHLDFEPAATPIFLEEKTRWPEHDTILHRAPANRETP